MKNVLIVDDSSTVRSMLREDLADLGVAIREAEDGRMALDICKELQDLSLIICDVNMPIMDGLDFLSELQKASLHQKIPKIMLTTESGADLKARGKALGVVAWVTKPHNSAALKLAIKQILRI